MDPKAFKGLQPDPGHARWHVPRAIVIRSQQQKHCHPGHHVCQPGGPHLAATQISITPDFTGTVQLAFPFSALGTPPTPVPDPHDEGGEMLDAVAAHT